MTDHGFPQPQVTMLLLEILNGLEYLHARKIVHGVSACIHANACAARTEQVPQECLCT